MRISPSSFPTIAGAQLVLILASSAVAVFAAAQTNASCPDIIASLLPKNGSVRGGQYTAGPMGIGGGSADLPFEHPCLKSTKYPARISVAVTYFGGEMAELLKMQGGAANEQTLLNALRELQRSKRTPKREKLGSGEIAFIDYTSECPPEGEAGGGTVNRPPIPNVELTGVALTTNVRLEVTLKGQISLDRAKAAVGEVFENLKKADFTKAK